MRTTLSWAAAAALMACIVGCSQEAPTKKAPGPSAATPQPDATPAVAAANLVTLHVDGMV